jgi:thiamine biosynthesis lipoprotein ApbE
MTTSKPSYKRARPALGTLVVLSLQEVTPDVSPDVPLHLSGDEAERLFASAFAELTRLEKIFNFFDEESELSALNRSSETQVEVSAELARVLESGAQIERISGGAFRLMPRCPHPVGTCYSLTTDAGAEASDTGYTRAEMSRTLVTKTSCQFDLGGIAKGAIVDFVFEHLQSLAPDAKITVNAGGDLRSSESQSIEIRVPGREKNDIAENGAREIVQSAGHEAVHEVERRFGLEIPAGAIATSSVDAQGLEVGTASARYTNEHRGHAMSLGRRTASVVAQTCAVADAWTKVALFFAEKNWNKSGEKLGAEAVKGLDAIAAELGVLAQYRFDQDGMPL